MLCQKRCLRSTTHDRASANSGLISLVVFIVSDALFSLLPITFIVQVRCSFFEKVVLTFIMGLGILASISGIIKLIGITQWASTTDPTWDLVPLLVWAFSEQYIAIWAACIPCLKGPFTRVVQSFSNRFSSRKSSRNGDSTGLSAFALDSDKSRNNSEVHADKSRNNSAVNNDIKVLVTVDVVEA
jgi:hypothetical protein